MLKQVDISSSDDGIKSTTTTVSTSDSLNQFKSNKIRVIKSLPKIPPLITKSLSSSSQLNEISPLITDENSKYKYTTTSQFLSPLNQYISSLKRDPSLSNIPQLTRCGTPHHNEAHSYFDKKSPLHSVLWNQINCILGAGIIALPYVYKQTGLIIGLILIVFFGLINGYTGNLLIISAKRTSKKNYEALFEGIYGNFGYWMVSIFMFINDFGGDLSYLIILSDSLTYLLKLFKYDTFINRELTIIVLAFLIIFPMCIQRDLSKIEKYSFISILSVIAVIVVVIYEYFRISFTNKIFIPHNIHYFDINGIFEAMGILSFSFTYQDTSFLVYQTLFNPTILRWKLLTKLSIGTVVSLFICFSIPGYFTFGNSVQANIINNYPANNYLIIAIRLLYILTMSLCFTMRFFVVRHILFSIFNYGSEYSESKSIRHASKIKFSIYTIIPFLIIIGIVLMVNDLGIVMSMTGCFSSSMLSLVLPCIAYIKTYSTTKIVNETKNSYYLDIIPAILCLIFGLFIMIFSSSWTLYRYITSNIH